MNKIEFFKKAMANNAFKTKAWVITAFSIIQEDMNTWTKNPYPYRIVQMQTGYFFVDPDSNNQLSLIEGCILGQPPFSFKETIELKAGELINLKKDLTTTVGNVFFNYCCISYSFGSKMDFIEDEVNVRKIEEQLANRLEDEDSKVDNCIFVSEYLKFVNSLTYLTNFTQLCVWAATAKSMTGPPGITEYKNELLKKFEGRLDDPAAIAEIDAALVKYDAAYLKGDPSENFLISKKSREIVRKKMFLMSGAETGLSDGIKVDLVTNSLEQGWQPDKYKAMINTSRGGSFNRGAQTQLGGESVKWLLRASSNISATEKDCGTTLGRMFTATQANLNKLVGFNIIQSDGVTLINNIEDAGNYLGKTVMVRSPMYCKLDKTDFCLTCVGKRLAQNPTAISMAVSETGSAFLSLFMKKMHGTSLTTAKLDYKTAIT